MSSPPSRVVNLGKFRNRAAELIRSVEQSGRPLVIARRGRPVVEVRPVGEPPATPLGGSVTDASGVDLTEPAVSAEAWDALR